MSQFTGPTLDLHGFKSDEIFDELDRFIMKYRSAGKVCVIVGKGKGIVKKKAIEYLKLGHYPWVYEKVYGQTNEGALIVEL